MYQDKSLICRECGGEFVFTIGEQEFYAERGFETEPVRCPDCRQKRKQSVKKTREIFEIVCSECGEVDTITFEPRHDIPIYCHLCYKKKILL